MRRLGLEVLSVFGLPPVEFIHLAADLGCANVSMLLAPFDTTKLSRPIDTNPHRYPRFDLVTDRRLRRDVGHALRERDVRISLAEGLSVRPGRHARDRAAELDAFAELGAQRVNLVSLDPDWSRTRDELAMTCAMAAQRGMDAVVEFAPETTVSTMSRAVEVIRFIGLPAPRLLIDTMHLARTGAGPADLEEVTAPGGAGIGYVQISDVRMPGATSGWDYMEEAMVQRLTPGQGDVPLLDLLRRVPRDCVVSIEVPQIAAARSGIGPRDRLAPVVAATRYLLEKLDEDTERERG